jgi:hypothetical protein
MNKSRIISIIALIFMCQFAIATKPTSLFQTDSVSGLSFSFNADLASRYIWRGLPLDLSANIQPYTSLSYNDFSFGAWGSYSLANPFSEMDLYLSYSAGLFTLTLNDYFNEDETDLACNDYFDWKNTDTTCTPHSLEGSVTFNGTENLPLSITAATFFYGNDKDTSNDNYYSTYLELAYTFNIKENEIKLFAGGTIAEGYYAPKAAIVNLGFSASREIKITDSFSIPVSASLILNPNAKDVFFVFGMTF